ncbi:hypothetical protein N7517_009372 [Penicillium concentricum]|uniref:Uncharacterized protein n=1 Tax=Penicillium concentricum TaxID=293559 RepID=A0A9W9RHE9_9EURO|nr:uncharacterized protein N7517_009372 [Penicillium concentricum]KAJ5360181.1 hypothetical protein N7517_009372 [Penicillium concentricum]
MELSKRGNEVSDIRMIRRFTGQCHPEFTPPVQGHLTQSPKVDSKLDSVNTRPGGQNMIYSQRLWD